MNINYKEYSIHPYHIYEFPCLKSTNQYANAYSLAETKDRMVIYTPCQTAGRGQVGNTWESEPDKNLNLSILLRPEKLKAKDQFIISMIVALGCCRFITRYVDDCSIKWPNDIYVGDKKIAGILIEHTIMGDEVALSISGIGLNINQKEFLSDAPNPISLTQLTDASYDLKDCLYQLIMDIEYYYKQKDNNAFLRHSYLNQLYRRDGLYKWKDRNELFWGSIITVDEFGRLGIKSDKGEERYYGFKEIQYLI